MTRDEQRLLNAKTTLAEIVQVEAEMAALGAPYVLTPAEQRDRAHWHEVIERLELRVARQKGLH